MALYELAVFDPSNAILDLMWRQGMFVISFHDLFRNNQYTHCRSNYYQLQTQTMQPKCIQTGTLERKMNDGPEREYVGYSKVK